MTDLAEAAQSYASAGYAVHPLVPLEKRPATQHGCKDATCDLTTVAQWWEQNPRYNIGIATGGASGIVVIDVDDPDAWDHWQETNGEPPPTLETITGSGGQHLVYQRPEGGLPNSASKIIQGVDVRGDGGYIVAPPSTTDQTYRIVAHRDPAELPQWFIDELTKPSEPSSQSTDGAASEPDGTAWGRKVLDGELSRLMGAGEGQRNVTLFHAACKVSEAVKGGHLNDGEARDRIEQGAIRILGLPAEEARKTIDSAWDRTKPRDPAEPLHTNSEPEQPAAVSDDSPSGMMSLDDLFGLEPTRWLIRNRLPEGFTILFGRPKSGKTFVALDWSLYLASMQARPVIYGSGEGVRGFQDRIRSWRFQHPDLDPSQTFYARAMGDFPRLLDRESMRSLHHDIQRMPQPPVLLVVDTWARAMVGGDEISGRDTQQAVQSLNDLQSQYGCHVLVLHHTAFPPGGKPPDRPRGHGALDGSADAMWRVDPPQKEGEWHQLVATAMKEASQPPPVDFVLAYQGNSLVVEPPVRVQVEHQGGGRE